MKYFPQISLKYLVPLVIITVATLLSVFLYFTTKPELLKTVEEDAEEDVQVLLNRVQGPIETLLRHDNLDAVQSVVASFGAELGHELMFLTDVQGNITASTKLEQLNKNWTELSEYQDPNLISEILETRSTVTRLSEGKQRVFGYSSICAGQSTQIVRPKDCGYLYYRQNINNRKTLALAGLNNETFRVSIGIITAAFLVWLVIYLQLTRRVERLITTGKKFTQGDQTARAQIKGADELASIGNIFDTMLDKTIADTNALSKSEAHLRAVIDTSVEGIVTINKQGIIQSINSSAQRMFDYRVDEAIGSNVSMLMPSPYRQQHDDYLNNYIQTGEAKIIGIGREVQGKRKDGSVFPMALSVGEFFVDGQQFFTGIVRDISHQKKSEEALRLINAAATQSRDAILITTCELDEPGPEIIFVNPAYEKMTGYSAEEVIGKTPRILQGPKTNKETLMQLRRTLEEGKPWSGEAVNYRKDGSEFDLQWNIDAIRNETGEISNWVATLRDVSEEKKSIELLRLREEEFQLIFENAPTGVALIGLEGNYLNVNPSLCDILGYSRPELLSLSYEDITHPDDLEISKTYFFKLLNGDFNGYSLDKHYIRKDQTVVNVVLNVALVHENVALAHDEKGNPALIITHILDITEQIKAEENARIQQEQLAHMDRVSMMGEMAAGIAHEINQPLTAIDSYAKAAQRRLQDNSVDFERLQGLLEKISKASLRAGDVITHLRAMAKRQTKEHAVLSINSLVEDAVNMARADTNFVEFEIKLQLDKALPSIMADSIQIQQVVLNLIRNAMDAAKNEEKQHKLITVYSSLLAEENRIQVSVKDYGSGLDEEDAEQVFNPFFTTKQTGMGMGLAICQSIIQLHGGRLWFTRNSDQGTTFHFTLPAALGDENE